jgi:broad specificity polyphosphatase/5'/3'-nucleotidase SurE
MALGSAAPRRDRASVLVVNDDGIDAPGILALANCGTFDVYVAAPDAERSACAPARPVVSRPVGRCQRNLTKLRNETKLTVLRMSR